MGSEMCIRDSFHDVLLGCAKIVHVHGISVPKKTARDQCEIPAALERRPPGPDYPFLPREAHTILQSIAPSVKQSNNNDNAKRTYPYMEQRFSGACSPFSQGLIFSSPDRDPSPSRFIHTDMQQGEHRRQAHTFHLTNALRYSCAEEAASWTTP